MPEVVEETVVEVAPPVEEEAAEDSDDDFGPMPASEATGPAKKRRGTFYPCSVQR